MIVRCVSFIKDLKTMDASLWGYESNNKSLCDDFMCFLKSTDTFLFQWNNLFLVPKVKLDPIEQILIFVRMEQFVLTVQLDSTVQILIFVPMVQLDATNSKVCPIVTKFYICSNIIFLLSYVMQQKVSVPIIYFFYFRVIILFRLYVWLDHKFCFGGIIFFIM